MSLKKIFVVFLLIFISIFSTAEKILAVGSETPEIINYKDVIRGVNDEYLVKGKTFLNSEVLIYIDGTFVDFAEIYDQVDGYLLFRYRLNKEIEEGNHKFMAVGRDKTSMVLSPPTKEFLFSFVALPKPPAPTIIQPKEKEIVSDKPLFTGLTRSGTRVRLYLNGALVYISEILQHPSQTANFAFRPEASLSVGEYHLVALAEDKFGQLSLNSEINFRVEPSLPSPVLLRANFIKTEFGRRAQIVGLAKNDLIIKIFINDKLDGEFAVINHPSGTANFSYLSAGFLPDNFYRIYAVAYNRFGKASKKSNFLTFSSDKKQFSGKIKPAIKPIITPTAASEESKIADKEIEENLDKKINQDIADLIKKPTTSKDIETGLINERRERQSKIKLNLLIFILFLLSVIGWIVWVNRELNKEKRIIKEKQEKKN